MCIRDSSYYVQFLKSQSLPVLTITRDENGIDLTQLQYLFQHYDIKFFYTCLLYTSRCV